MSSALNPSSILEIYIQAQKDKFNQEQQALKDEAAVEQAKADTEFRNKQSKQLAIDLDTEHERNLADLAAKRAQLDAAQAQLEHSHLQSKMDILKGVQEGQIPIPGQTFTPNGNSVTGKTSNGIPIAEIPQGTYQKQPIVFNGVRLEPHEYSTVEEALKHNQPFANTEIANKGKLAEATERGVENVRSAPGGLYEQQNKLEQAKLDNAAKIADIQATRAENTAKINSASRELAAKINASARITAAKIGKQASEINPEELEERANQLFYGEGAPAGKTKLDLQAAAVNSKAGRSIVPPKTVENIKGLKPLEGFADDMTDFANKYLGDSWFSGAANIGRLSSPITNDEQNAYNQLLINSTNIAKGIEGATGRILMAQIQVAKDFVSRKNVTQGQMLDNARKINDALVTAVEGQLGNLKPRDRVDFLQHHGFDTIAAYAAKKWKVAGPAEEETELPSGLGKDWVRVK